jgi:hypothetical protein
MSGVWRCPPRGGDRRAGCGQHHRRDGQHRCDRLHRQPWKCRTARLTRQRFKTARSGIIDEPSVILLGWRAGAERPSLTSSARRTSPDRANLSGERCGSYPRTGGGDGGCRGWDRRGAGGCVGIDDSGRPVASLRRRGNRDDAHRHGGGCGPAKRHDPKSFANTRAGAAARGLSF